VERAPAPPANSILVDSVYHQGEGGGEDGGWQSPAERLNQHRYHDNWLHNLLVSASLAGYRA
jgi:hypothetical protein